jgi:hypothetical protein
MPGLEAMSEADPMGARFTCITWVPYGRHVSLCDFGSRYVTL